jgi:broad specificity phosphatase PhoE
VKIVLLRHGETEWSKSGQHTGRVDIPLLPEGEAAVAAVRHRLESRSFDLVLCSPMLRARRTAELAGFAPVIDDDLQEWSYGEYEGRTTAEIRTERPGWDIWRDGCPGGEAVEDVGARADRVIARVLAAGVDRALLIAHGHFLRILGSRWVELDASAGGRLAMFTAALSELGFERERRVVLRWNDTRHVPKP